MIITIDGPAGAGKSSAAKALAQRLNFDFLDTGATYRALTLAVLQSKIDYNNHTKLSHCLSSIEIAMPPGKVMLNGKDVSNSIRTQEVSNLASTLATVGIVREQLAQLQRDIAQGRDMVCEGRDQGTVVFPDAECKFFLLADPVERAKRRQSDLAKRGQVVELETLIEEQKERDQRDSQRDIAPMKPAEDAIHIDSTALTLEQVVDLMEDEVRKKQGE